MIIIKYSIGVKISEVIYSRIKEECGYNEELIMDDSKQKYKDIKYRVYIYYDKV